MADGVGVTGGFCAQRSVTDCDSTMHAIEQKPLAQAQSATPHARRAELKLPPDGPKGALYLRLECDDILGNTSKPKTVTVRR